MFPSQIVLDSARRNTNELVISSITFKYNNFISGQMPDDVLYIYFYLNSLRRKYL